MKPFSTVVYLTQSDIDITSADQIIFDSPEEQRLYFTDPNRSLMIDENRYIKNRNGMLKLDVDKTKLFSGKYNYLCYINPEHENKLFICNIVDYKYLNEAISEIYYSVDNFQTYMFDVDYSLNSIVTRRHYTRDETKDIMHLPYEDLDRGRHALTVINNTKVLGTPDDVFYTITLTKPFKENVSIISRFGTFFNKMSYLDSKNEKIEVDSYSTIHEGVIVYVVNSDALSFIIESLLHTVDFTNKLVKISYVPFRADYIPFKNAFNEVTGLDDFNGRRKLFYTGQATYQTSDTYDMFSIAGRYINKTLQGDFSLVDEYKTLEISDLPALGQYFARPPYTQILVDDPTGNTMLYGLDTTTERLTLKTYWSLGVISSIAYRVSEPYVSQVTQAQRDYFKEKDDKTNYLIETHSNDMSYIIPTETISFVTNNLNAFLQGQQMSIEQSRKNIATNFDMTIDNANAQAQRSLSGIQLAQTNRDLQMQTDVTNFEIGQQMAQQNHVLGMVGQGFNIGANLISGNIGGAVGSTLGMGINQFQFDNSQKANSQMFNNSLVNNLEMSNNSLEHQRNMTNSIKAQTMRNAKMGAKMQMDTLNARMLDVQNAPNSIASLSGGSMFNALYSRYMIHMKTRIIERSALLRVSNYLMYYGFLSNSYDNVENILKKHTYGSYIQTANINIKGNIPLDALNDIKQQFDTGLMLWKKPEYYKQHTLLREV